MRRDEVARDMFFLQSGMVEVLSVDEDLQEHWVATLKDGAWFGEIALLTESKRTASVRTITGCSLFRLEKPDFLDIRDKYPELATEISRHVGQRTKILAHVMLHQATHQLKRGVLFRREHQRRDTIEVDDARQLNPLFRALSMANSNSHGCAAAEAGSDTENGGSGGGGSPPVNGNTTRVRAMSLVESPELADLFARSPAVADEASQQQRQQQQQQQQQGPPNDEEEDQAMLNSSGNANGIGNVPPWMPVAGGQSLTQLLSQQASHLQSPLTGAGPTPPGVLSRSVSFKDHKRPVW
eukprot:TRINITY_DN5062_c5_g1_i3.p1 TRINITY_DN5062_c5_g1~~TRINITY_DN5062_c5_g1_i3.p1  ORF type:complete len:296 (+),score=72.66 TRINITY_DN5062_c5_g1_i3:476-1363(+)